jgi:quinol monooxygenase YgiN
MVTLLTGFRAKDVETARELGQLLSTLGEAARSEPGHVEYAAYAVEGDPLSYRVVETWATREDARRHVEAVATHGVADAAATLLADPPGTITIRPLARGTREQVPSKETQ